MIEQLIVNLIHQYIINKLCHYHDYFSFSFADEELIKWGFPEDVW